MKCQSLTKSGHLCHRTTSLNSFTCWQHDNNSKLYSNQSGGSDKGLRSKSRSLLSIPRKIVQKGPNRLTLKFKTGVELPSELQNIPKSLMDLANKRIIEDKIGVKSIIQGLEDMKILSLKITPHLITAIVESGDKTPFTAEEISNYIDYININGADTWMEGDISLLNEDDWKKFKVTPKTLINPKYKHEKLDYEAIQTIEQELKLISINDIPINFDYPKYYGKNGFDALEKRVQEILNEITLQAMIN